MKSSKINAQFALKRLELGWKINNRFQLFLFYFQAKFVACITNIYIVYFFLGKTCFYDVFNANLEVEWLVLMRPYFPQLLNIQRLSGYLLVVDFVEYQSNWLLHLIHMNLMMLLLLLIRTTVLNPITIVALVKYPRILQDRTDQLKHSIQTLF